MRKLAPTVSADFVELVVTQLTVHFDAVIFALLLVYIVALQVEVSEIERYAILRQGYNFPHAHLVRRVHFWERRRRYCAIWGIEYAAASICNIIITSLDYVLHWVIKYCAQRNV